MKVLYVTEYKPYSSQSTVDPYDGICGLMATSVSPGAELLVPSLSKAGKLDSNMFSTSYHGLS